VREANVNPVESLAALAGQWAGTSTLYDPHSGKPEASPSALTVTPVLGGRFVRLDYIWAYQGKPQEGSLLVGHDPATGTTSGHWIDTWHMGRAALALTGAGLTLRGTYPAPPGPDWGWRIDLTPFAGGLRLTMHNVYPADLGGKEEIAVEADYTRA
jgi:hypothetical protein